MIKLDIVNYNKLLKVKYNHFLIIDYSGFSAIVCFITNLSIPSIFQTEKAMAPHSSTLAWKIPWTEEPGRLQSMGSLRVRHD